MRKTFRHTGVLMMVAVVALGLVGAAYTMWYETLNLNATVSTGSVDVNWSTEPVHADHPDAVPQNATSDEVIGLGTNGVPSGLWYHFNIPTQPGRPADAKFVQNCSIGVGGTGDTIEPANPSQHTLVINATGLYPLTGCEFGFNIHNWGTVPVHLTQNVETTVTGTGVKLVNSGTGGVNWISGDSPTLPEAEALALCTDVVNMLLAPASTPLGGPLTWMDGTTSRVIQLHQGDQVNCRFWFYLAQDSTENASINITSTLIAHQWNENP